MKSFGLAGPTPLAVILLVGAAVACTKSPGMNRGTSTLLGYSVSSDELWSGPTITTCWENGTAATADWRQSLQQTIAAAYGVTSNVRFVGWGDCTDGPGLHLEIYKDGPTAYTRPADAYDGHPRALGLGNVLDGARPGVILNPGLSDVQPSLVQQAANMTAQQLANLQASIVVHEFGHVLGLMHEQARPDSPCHDYPDSNSGDGVEQGAYDPASIMNYCVTHTSNFDQALTLSAGDISTVNTLYAVPAVTAPTSTATSAIVNTALGLR